MSDVGRRREWPPEDGELAPLVDLVRAKGLAAFNGSDRGLISQIAGLLNAARDVGLASAGQADAPENILQSLFMRAIGLLDSAIEQQASPILLGLKGAAYGLELDVRQDKARLAYSDGTGWAPVLDTFRTKPKYERAIILNVARAIERLRRSQDTSGVDDAPTWTAQDSKYVQRKKEQAELAQKVAKIQITGLVGEGGVGKSTLAREFVQQESPAHWYMLLDATGPKSLVESARRELERLGVDKVWGQSADWIAAKLRSYLSDPARPLLFVVFDNLAEWDTLEPYILPRSRTKILFTARRRFDRIEPNCVEYIFIGSMSKNESTEMVRKFLTDASRDEIDRLSCLAGRAVAIKHVCAFLNDQSLSDRERWLGVLCGHVAQTVGFMTVSLDEVSLTAIYEDIVANLSARSDTTYVAETLLLLAWLQEHETLRRHVDDLMAYCLSIVISTENHELAALAYSSAMSVLSRYQLVTDGSAEHYIHPLTAEILRNIAKCNPARLYAVIFEAASPDRIVRTLPEGHSHEAWADKFSSYLNMVGFALRATNHVMTSSDPTVRALAGRAQKLRDEWPEIDPSIGDVFSGFTIDPRFYL